MLSNGVAGLTRALLLIWPSCMLAGLRGWTVWDLWGRRGAVFLAEERCLCLLPLFLPAVHSLVARRSWPLGNLPPLLLLAVCCLQGRRVWCRPRPPRRRQVRPLRPAARPLSGSCSCSARRQSGRSRGRASGQCQCQWSVDSVGAEAALRQSRSVVGHSCGRAATDVTACRRSTQPGLDSQLLRLAELSVFQKHSLPSPPAAGAARPRAAAAAVQWRQRVPSGPLRFAAQAGQAAAFSS